MKLSWTIKKAECWRTDSFELWCWRRLLRVPWTTRRSNQSILKEINPEYSLEGLMLKLQYFGHLMQRADSFEKTLMLGKIEGRRRRGWQRMSWWIASPCQWTRVWANSRRQQRIGNLTCWSWCGRRVGHNWATEQQQLPCHFLSLLWDKRWSRCRLTCQPDFRVKPSKGELQLSRGVAWVTLCSMSDTFPWSKTGVPSLWDLMPDELRWSWCDYNRNKVNNKCNALESSQNYPSTLVRRKTVFHEIGPWPPKMVANVVTLNICWVIVNTP